ncbi:hypothetical protein ASG67_00740 [Sphingomonas sp. Leaf339]|uniref:hypothetical protein n=1 Tax=Sphingomonas sp. Leaf339 TaxID=1736343 RepID=UPI0006FEE59A|nr:hypothetical protein [Sphingomonas sp. Leaf339]KQU61751.1 hypothetical protein ASG67_00740 [Sphingomonas sp. Leaf339]
MRPKSVILGEQVYAASIVMTIALAVMGWQEAASVGGPVLAATINVVVIGLTILLLLLATRRGSRVALWLLTALTAINVVGFLFQISGGVVAAGLFGVLTTLQTLSSVIAMVLLFRPNARVWFDGMSDNVTEDLV